MWGKQSSPVRYCYIAIKNAPSNPMVYGYGASGVWIWGNGKSRIYHSSLAEYPSAKTMAGQKQSPAPSLLKVYGRGAKDG